MHLMHTLILFDLSSWIYSLIYATCNLHQHCLDNRYRWDYVELLTYRIWEIFYVKVSNHLKVCQHVFRMETYKLPDSFFLWHFKIYVFTHIGKTMWQWIIWLVNKYTHIHLTLITVDLKCQKKIVWLLVFRKFKQRCFFCQCTVLYTCTSETGKKVKTPYSSSELLTKCCYKKVQLLTYLFWLMPFRAILAFPQVTT